jgi:hypothetical protein
MRRSPEDQQEYLTALILQGTGPKEGAGLAQAV